jgi:hypothetical protein
MDDRCMAVRIVGAGRLKNRANSLLAFMCRNKAIIDEKKFPIDTSQDSLNYQYLSFLSKKFQ